MANFNEKCLTTAEKVTNQALKFGKCEWQRGSDRGEDIDAFMAGEYDADIVTGKCLVFQQSLTARAAWRDGG